MSVRSGGANLDERVGLHWLLRIGVEADRVSATPAGVQDPFPAAVEALFIVGDQPLPRLQRVQPHRLWLLVIPDVPEAIDVAALGWLLARRITSSPFDGERTFQNARSAFHLTGMRESPKSAFAGGAESFLGLKWHDASVRVPR